MQESWIGIAFVEAHPLDIDMVAGSGPDFKKPQGPPLGVTGAPDYQHTPTVASGSQTKSWPLAAAQAWTSPWPWLTSRASTSACSTLPYVLCTMFGALSHMQISTWKSKSVYMGGVWERRLKTAGTLREIHGKKED